ncbi:hypothetical protein [Nocardia cyriacigeorgica]|uniref:hypothetical protein n=1 Tax=Nocardia cyriacigeorgica TaxID=135487 RepID=UPI0024585624|nr:hypothetical protein [Nocardia cyriacigeorgica]
MTVWDVALVLLVVALLAVTGAVVWWPVGGPPERTGGRRVWARCVVRGRKN